jgi:hypothetical protein
VGFSYLDVYLGFGMARVGMEAERSPGRGEKGVLVGIYRRSL